MNRKIVGIFGILIILLAVVVVSGCLSDEEYYITNETLDNGDKYQNYMVESTGNEYYLVKYNVNYDEALDDLEYSNVKINKTSIDGMDAVMLTIENNTCFLFKMGSETGMLIDPYNSKDMGEMKKVIKHFINSGYNETNPF